MFWRPRPVAKRKAVWDQTSIDSPHQWDLDVRIPHVQFSNVGRAPAQQCTLGCWNSSVEVPAVLGGFSSGIVPDRLSYCGRVRSSRGPGLETRCRQHGAALDQPSCRSLLTIFCCAFRPPQYIEADIDRDFVRGETRVTKHKGVHVQGVCVCVCVHSVHFITHPSSLVTLGCHEQGSSM